MTVNTPATATAYLPLRHRRDDELIEQSEAAAFVEELVAAGLELHSFLIAREDAIVFERHWWPARPGLLHTLHSATKSLVGTAVGLAVDEGALDLDDRVVDRLASHLSGAEPDGLERVTVRDLLTMRGGNASGISGATSRREEGSLVRLFLAEPIAHEPGSRFVYSSATSHLLSAVVQESTGRTTEQYLAEKLFAPLGIRSWRWDTDPDGVSTGGNGLRLAPEDLARFALAHANGGVWRGERILPAHWVADAGRRHVARAHAGTWDGQRLVGGAAADTEDGYGYQFWVHEGGSYSAQGVFGQTALIDPVSRVVVVTTGALTESQHDALLAALNTALLPLLREGANGRINARTEDRGAGENNRILTTSAPDEASDSGIRPAGIVDGVFVFDENPVGLESLTVRVADDGVEVAFTDARGRHSLWNPYEGWSDGVTSVYGWQLHHSYECDDEPVLTHGGWIRADTLELDWRFPEMPFRDRLRVTFDGDAATVDRWTNVNSGATRLPTLSARRSAHGG